MVKRIEKKDRKKAAEAAKKAEPEKKKEAPADTGEEKKDATKASPTIESTSKMSSQAVSQGQQSQQHRHDLQDKQI
jgi:hypothetical protein